MSIRISPESPFVQVMLVKPKWKGDCWHWQVLKCPYCGNKHLHGAGENPDTVARFLSHRVAHCPDPSGKGYNLCVGNPWAKPGLVCLADIEPVIKKEEERMEITANLDSTFEIKKDDPLYKWLAQHDLLRENMNLIAVLKAMPKEMAAEFLRRMITAQAVGEQDADTVKNLAKIAFKGES
jgi:hypothetical protein